MTLTTWHYLTFHLCLLVALFHFLDGLNPFSLTPSPQHTRIYTHSPQHLLAKQEGLK